MQARLTRDVASTYDEGTIHLAGTLVNLIRPVGKNRESWIVEIKVSHDHPTCHAWYETLVLPAERLDLEENLKPAESA